VHPTAGEIVAATHGRSLWILDVSALRQIKPDTLKEKAHLYKPNTTVRWVLEPAHGKTNRRFVGENPKPGAHIFYSITDAAKKVTIEVKDIEGKTISKLSGSVKPGMHKTTWDMTRPIDPDAKGEPAEKVGKGKKGGFGGQGARRFAAPGDYRVDIDVEGEGFRVNATTTLRLEGDPNVPPGRRLADEEVPPLKNIE